MRLLKHVALCGILLGATACASPRVHITPLSGIDLEGKIKFQLAESVILFQETKDKAGNVVPNSFEIVSVPVPSGQVYALDGANWHENWGVETDLNVTFRPNTRMIQDIGVEVKDRRQEIITGVAKVVTTAIGVARIARQPTALPPGLPVSKLLVDTTGTCLTNSATKAITCTNYPLGGTPSATANIEVSEVPSDAVAANRLATAQTGPVLYYSACRTLKIEVTLNNGHQAPSVSLAVADPNWLQTVRFPDKGKISMHPSCGVNVTAEDAETATGLELVESLMTAAKSINDAK